MKKTLLSLAITAACLSSAPAISTTLTESNTFFIWAEQNYPSYFSPSNAETQLLNGYVVRYYSETDTYLGTQDNNVYVYGTLFNDIDPSGLSVKNVENHIGAIWLFIHHYNALIKNKMSL